MSDVSEKEEQINGNTIPARPTSEDYLKEEEIDEDDIHVVGSEEPDASGEADNTYYNIGGKRVAVAKLAEYIKHKTQGELCNDFEVSKGIMFRESVYRETLELICSKGHSCSRATCLHFAFKAYTRRSSLDYS